MLNRLSIISSVDLMFSLAIKHLDKSIAQRDYSLQKNCHLQIGLDFRRSSCVME